MSVKGVGRGGRAGGPGKAGGASGPAKAGGASFNAKVDKAESLVGPSGAAASGNVGNVGNVAAADPVTAQVLDLARQLKSGQLKSRDEATKKLVSDILREKVRLQSKKLTDKIVEQLKDDPRLNQTLDRLWDRAEGEQG